MMRPQPCVSLGGEKRDRRAAERFRQGGGKLLGRLGGGEHPARRVREATFHERRRRTCRHGRQAIADHMHGDGGMLALELLRQQAGIAAARVLAVGDRDDDGGPFAQLQEICGLTDGGG